MTGPSGSLLRDVLAGLRNPEKLHSVDAVRTGRHVPPNVGGVYGWYFRTHLPGVPASSHTYLDMELLYVGTAPSRAGSRSTLRHRIRSHSKGDASRSTLRLSIGSVLGYRRDPTRPRFWFGSKETDLSGWLRDNAMVCWVECATPWAIEKAVIGELHPPLNLDHNEDSPFFRTLSGLREEARLGRSDSL